MWATLAAIFPTIAGWINLVVEWFQARAAAQTASNQAEGQAETQHQTDGQQSVVDGASDDAQNVDLDQQAQQLDNPTPVVVTSPTQPPPQGGTKS